MKFNKLKDEAGQIEKELWYMTQCFLFILDDFSAALKQVNTLCPRKTQPRWFPQTLLMVAVCLLQIYIPSLTSSTSEWYLIRKWGSCRCNDVRQSTPSSSIAHAHVKSRDLGTDTHIQWECHVKIKEEIGWCVYKARNAKDCQQITRCQGKAIGWILFSQPSRRRRLDTLSSDFQFLELWDNMYFCCFSHVHFHGSPHLWI